MERKVHVYQELIFHTDYLSVNSRSPFETNLLNLTVYLHTTKLPIPKWDMTLKEIF